MLPGLLSLRLFGLAFVWSSLRGKSRKLRKKSRKLRKKSRKLGKKCNTPDLFGPLMDLTHLLNPKTNAGIPFAPTK